ncbi:hypothetical protein CEXT_155491 [Caerostris extrusa]|uniref:LAGLIDADG homing endonuclease n=1 Tax=Caerostris extrusa TaxID=172846 RepID=A0AAV4X9Z0_CAEEX|nr:hypothetical protein CEXT_155491 [Caerostris extrusa]
MLSPNPRVVFPTKYVADAPIEEIRFWNVPVLREQGFVLSTGFGKASYRRDLAPKLKSVFVRKNSLTALEVMHLCHRHQNPDLMSNGSWMASGHSQLVRNLDLRNGMLKVYFQIASSPSTSIFFKIPNAFYNKREPLASKHLNSGVGLCGNSRETSFPNRISLVYHRNVVVKQL